MHGIWCSSNDNKISRKEEKQIKQQIENKGCKKYKILKKEMCAPLRQDKKQ